jgi:predicted HAD superfamily Cof-like phosphohydrolase
MTKTPDMIADITAFHEKYLQAYEGPPRHLPLDIVKFCMGFQREECKEFENAVAEGNVADQLDALVDMVYVALGTAYLGGWNFGEAWNRVHEKNMQKIPPSDGELKVKKPEGWTPPDHSDLVPTPIEAGSDEHFAAWFVVLQHEAVQQGFGPNLPADEDKAAWLTYFEDRLTPSEALAEEMSE